MANQFAAYIYGYGANAQNSTSPVGQSMSFPSQGVFMQAITPGVQMGGGVVCNTQITLLPGTAPSPIIQTFYSPALVGSLVTAANA